MTDHRWHDIDLMTDRAHSARIYDYLLGGKTNYAADREAAEALLALTPTIRATAQANRAFMRRATHHLAHDHGIRQFLDVGAGIPTAPNLHQVAQAVLPESRVVYIDNDPIVMAHARALMIGDRRGRTAYIEADVRDPGAIIEAPELAETLDVSEPIALSLFALLHFLEDDDAYNAVRELVDFLPSGSFLSLTAASDEFNTEIAHRSATAVRDHGINVRLRSMAEIERFFAGLDLLEPGLVQVHRWRPDGDLPSAASLDAGIDIYGGVARKW
ncbi:SAM-dependent methyltransferase [Pseudonocardia sp. TRM90224]|uniref:SAM-dependent methyltransferase n=1 Tax=Pseudonocardia sp. TRM90224 TaxID=2812678 RepID=UPI001E529943|nr:SAM-dependent methyltransferase [Pseudonocardia sp. TRM90224]